MIYDYAIYNELLIVISYYPCFAIVLLSPVNAGVNGITLIQECRIHLQSIRMSGGYTLNQDIKGTPRENTQA